MYVGEEKPANKSGGSQIGLHDLLVIFFKAGLAFGGGLGILAVLEDEFVTRRNAITQADFMALYGIGRIVPSGTMTALAVGLGHRFGGFPGTAIALGAMVLPALILTILLTMLYQSLKDTTAFHAVEASILPAALALIVVAALRLGRNMLGCSVELSLAVFAFVGTYFLRLNPALLLIAGGLIGAVAFMFTEERGKPR